MSNDGKGILHFLGIGFTVVTTLVSILTQCQPKEDKHAVRNTMLLQTPPKKPILRPMYWAELLDPDWNDSMPFDFGAVAAAGMRYITVEEYSLSPGEDTLKQALEWGEEKGERTRLTQFTLDMNRPVLRSLITKEFRGTDVEPPKSVVWSGRYEFSFANDGSLESIDISERGDGNDRQEKATARTLEENRRILSFERSPDWRFLKDINDEAVLMQSAEGGRMTFFTPDSASSLNSMKISALKMLKVLIRDGESSLADDLLEIELVQGNRMHPRRRVLMNREWKPTLIKSFQLDAEGRPDSSIIEQVGEQTLEIKERYIYGQYGLEELVAEFPGMNHRMRVAYVNGWPKRMVLWSEMPDGGIKVLARIFIRFQSN